MQGTVKEIWPKRNVWLINCRRHLASSIAACDFRRRMAEAGRPAPQAASIHNDAAASSPSHLNTSHFGKHQVSRSDHYMKGSGLESE